MPLVQNDILIGNRNRGRQKLADSSDNAAAGKVAAGIIVSANDQDSEMMTLHGNHEIVQILKVGVVPAQKDPLLTDRVGQVDGVVLPRHSHIGWHLCVVPGSLQQLAEQRGGQVVVQGTIS
jgi:hypothetical protein